MRAIPIVAVVFVAASCAQSERAGAVYACVVSSDDDPAAPPITVSRRGLRVVDDPSIAAPAEFEACAIGKSVRATFIDENGATVFVAVDARVGARELIPRNIFDAVDNGTLSWAVGGPWSPFMSIVFSQNDQLLLAGQQGGGTLAAGALRVEDGGGTSLPTLNCAWETTIDVAFTDDNGITDAGTGETVELIVGGVEWSGTNFGSASYEEGGCEDGPTGTHLNFVAVDNSF
jgi:hypothetical protein